MNRFVFGTVWLYDCVLNFVTFFANRDIMVSDNMKFNGDFEATVDDT